LFCMNWILGILDLQKLHANIPCVCCLEGFIFAVLSAVCSLERFSRDAR
jgi:hypothetical protein